MLQEVRGYIAEKKGTVSFNYITGGSIHSNPVLYKDVIYFSACDRRLYGLGLDGKEKLVFRAEDIPFHPAIYNDVIYFGCYDHNLYAVALDGKLLWKFPTKGKVISRPAIENNVASVYPRLKSAVFLARQQLLNQNHTSTV